MSSSTGDIWEAETHPLPNDKYTVGWITALEHEAIAAKAALDVFHGQKPKTKHTSDQNLYILGQISGHNVVIASLPAGVIKSTTAATTAMHMLASFPSIKIGLLVGIGGGIPKVNKDGKTNKIYIDRDIRLGDVVVSQPNGTHGGVKQYDFGKTITSDILQPSGFLNIPPRVLLNTVGALGQIHRAGDRESKMPMFLDQILKNLMNTTPSYKYPGAESDRLFEATYMHPKEKETCEVCNKSREIIRTNRPTRNPGVHYGVIASGNKIIKDAAVRDRLGSDVLCFEMEAAGIMNEFPCIVIRGICDYADSHQNDSWQRYAAAAAAAYAKEILDRITEVEIEQEAFAKDILWAGSVTSSSKAGSNIEKYSIDIEALRHAIPRMAPPPAPATSPGFVHIDWPTPIKYRLRGRYMLHSLIHNFQASRNNSTSTAGITATTNSKLSWDSQSSEHAQEPANTSVTQTSQEIGGSNRKFTDNTSVYTSHISESSHYIQELTASFFEGSQPPDTESLERILEILPDVLQGFALKIGGEQQAPENYEIMTFLHYYRRKIEKEFEEYYLRDKDDARSVQKLNRSAFTQDDVGNWVPVSVMDDLDSSILRPPDALFLDEDAEADESDEPSVDKFQPSKYREIVKNSVAYEWLLCRMHREVSLTSSKIEATAMHAIAAQIREKLYSLKDNRIFSSKKGPPSCSMIFKSDWNPLAFLKEQEYIEKPEDALERAIVIVQDANENSEAMTCLEYASRTWPLLGEDIIGLVKYAASSKPGLRYSVVLFDSTKLTAWLEPPGCFILEAVGPVETIVEVGELYGWLTTALRSAPGDKITSAWPILVLSTQNRNLELGVLQRLDCPLRSSGQCWQDLFRNPLVVAGFPVQRRQPGQEPGLEVSLDTLAALVRTRRITLFCGRVFLKGFCTMLVPTKYVEGTVHWHVLFNQNGGHISFTDSRVRDVVGDFDLTANLSLSEIETARHVVGWCDQAKNYAGSKEANYAIGKSGLKRPDSGFAFDRVTVSAGKIVTAGASVALGKKDKPGRREKKSDYHKQLDWAEEQFVVLYDCKNRRAWLIDGLSALLHLVRASVAHRRELGRKVLFSENDIKEPDNPYAGKSSARAVLENMDNMNLKIRERWNRLVEETSLEHTEGATPKTTSKRQTTWEQLPDLVGDIYNTLEILFEIQTDELTADGYAFKIRKSPRKHLEGWDFRDVVSEVTTLWPKATLLQDVGLGWVDLIRAVNAITLFGTDFGEIIQPSTADQTQGPGAVRPNLPCSRWTQLQRNKDLLATTTPVIRDIMDIENRGPGRNGLFELFPDIYWHSPDKIFEGCHCSTAPQCDPVQILLPTQFPKIFARGFRTPPAPLPDHGAVIFGHSLKFPLTWGYDPGTVPTEGPPPAAEAAPSSSHQSGSGFELSLASTTPENTSTLATSTQSADTSPGADRRSAKKRLHLFTKKLLFPFKAKQDPEASGGS